MRDHAQATEHHRHCEPQRPGWPRAPSPPRVLGFAYRLDRQLGALIEAAAVVGQRQFPRGAGKQPCAKMFLQSGHLPADGWLARVLLLRDTGERTGFDDSDESAKQGDYVRHSYIIRINHIRSSP